MNVRSASIRPPVGYNPTAPPRPTQQVGLLVVVGNDSRAMVRTWGRSVLTVHCEDNDSGCPRHRPPSAFQRCVDWALANQHLAHEGSLFW